MAAAIYPGFTAWPQEDLFIFTLALARKIVDNQPVSLDSLLLVLGYTREEMRVTKDYLDICMISRFRCPTDGGDLYWDPYGKFVCALSGKLVGYQDMNGEMVPTQHE